MKIKAGPKPKVAAPAKATLEQKREALTGVATRAVAKAIVASAKHPMLEGFGEALGMGLGVIVTEALALAPGWNKPVLDAGGKPVAGVDGATRIGDHEIRKRHEEVVGPKVAALVEKLPAGLVHDLLEGLAKGATEAPGTSYRLEAEIAD